MAIDKIEALADAIGKLNGIHNPESDAYKLRNPGLIQSFAKPGKHEVDDQGRRVFSSFLSGYKAFCFDLKVKLSGESRAGLTATSTLENLLGTYRISGSVGIDHVVAFLRRAIDDATISKKTPITFFLQ